MSPPPPQKRSKLKKVQKIKLKMKRKLFQYSDEALQAALREIRENKLAVREASRKFGVPKSTIQDRLNGKIPEKQGKTGPEPLLSVGGEKKIADWILNLAKCGFPINKTDLIETVEKLVKDSGKVDLFKDGRPGKRWYLNFLKRHPEISLREAESTSTAKAATEENIRLWFQNLEKYLNDNKFHDILKEPDRIFNGEGLGFYLCPNSGKVVAPKKWENLHRIKRESEKQNVTMLVCFSASGKICPPLVVLPYIKPPSAVVKNIPKGWVLGKSQSGWLNVDAFIEYIANDFNKWLSENNTKRPVLFLIDGHKLHMTLELNEVCERNGIILYALPANLSDILRPAGDVVFQPLKAEWKSTIRKWQSLPENADSSVTKVNVCKVFEMVLNETNMVDRIKNGFKKCGLFPLNANNVDYTKCDKNNSLKEIITSEECIIAEKVLRRIEDRLYAKGINVNVIINEIRLLEAAQMKL